MVAHRFESLFRGGHLRNRSADPYGGIAGERHRLGEGDLRRGSGFFHVSGLFGNRHVGNVGIGKGDAIDGALSRFAADEVFYREAFFVVLSNGRELGDVFFGKVVKQVDIGDVEGIRVLDAS